MESIDEYIAQFEPAIQERRRYARRHTPRGAGREGKISTVCRRLRYMEISCISPQ
jgi:hypothetical protein